MEELIKHYCDLLILQYKFKPKARATIEAFVRALFEGQDGNIFLNELQNAYDLDTAQLTQLELLSKYVGYDSTLNIVNTNYFRLSDTEGLDITPGLSDTEDNFSGYPLLNYSGYTYTQTSLPGVAGIDFYRKTLQFLIEMKNEVLSLGNLDRLLYKYYGEDLYVVEGDKQITYVYNEIFLKLFDTQEDVIQTFIKKYMPRPMGCGLVMSFEPKVYLGFTINTSESLTYTIKYGSQFGSMQRIMVDWGDGTHEFYNSPTVFPTHIYSQAQDYQIKIIPLDGLIIPNIIFGNQYRPDEHSNALKSIDFNKCCFQHTTGEPVTRFDYMFCNCQNLVSVDKDLFKCNTEAVSFYKTFYNCGLTEIDKDLFKENTKAYNFGETFAFNADLEDIPKGLFGNLVYTENPNFEKCFYDRSDNDKCKINADIFLNDNNSSQRANKFKNVVPNFYLTFSRGYSFIGTQGTAPRLWNYTYKTAPNGRDCFLGQSSTSLTNYSNIPSDWGGD